jgi:hypothetical protein
VIRARVSNLEEFRKWRDDEDQIPADLVLRLTNFQPTEPMKAGTAFHKALESVQDGEHEHLHADGYTFILPDGQIALPAIRELRAFGSYGELEVTGCVDGLQGRTVNDHKTTARADFERYLTGYSWRYYLDLFDADRFRWDIYEIKHIKGLIYQVSEPQMLETFCYPGMHDDCRRLAEEFYEFASVHMPGYDAMQGAS